MSGIRLRAGGNDLRTFRVSQVLEDSPAAEARLREDDVLTAIDGAPASKFALDEIYQMLKRPGREYKLSLRRNGETFFVKIRMRRLVLTRAEQLGPERRGRASQHDWCCEG